MPGVYQVLPVTVDITSHSARFLVLVHIYYMHYFTKKYTFIKFNQIFILSGQGLSKCHSDLMLPLGVASFRSPSRG